MSRAMRIMNAVMGSAIFVAACGIAVGIGNGVKF